MSRRNFHQRPIHPNTDQCLGYCFQPLIRNLRCDLRPTCTPMVHAPPPITKKYLKFRWVAEILDAKQMRAAAADLDAELMQSMPDPASFDPKYRSPCWSEAREGGTTLRCLPAALISGVFHSGSSSLAGQLLQHPDVVTDGSGNSQFWAEDGKTAGGYIDGFAQASLAAQASPASALIIDQSPSTFSFYWSAGAP